MQYQEIVNEQGERFLLPLIAVGCNLAVLAGTQALLHRTYPVAYPTYLPMPYPYPVPKPYSYPLPLATLTPFFKDLCVSPVRP